MTACLPTIVYMHMFDPDMTHGIGDVVCSRIAEIDHDTSIACWIAATILGLAPQRQMLPLMSSRISSGVFALPSAIRPTLSRSAQACNSRIGRRRGR